MVAYRIARAKETLTEADLLIGGQYYNVAVNRLYYACYYAVIAILVKYRINAQTYDEDKKLTLHSLPPVNIIYGKTEYTL
ncbi:HEPN domain-containing protein [uncultured Parabacteroides sp.]|uniref:HEPN domain-containing protein n=1 Tax=uncultured Parabacteroides sp. TaxID=512312 RepID=UPI00341C7A3E